MKLLTLTALASVLLLPVFGFAQNPDGPPRDGGGRDGERGFRGRFPNPVMEALDTDKDGELSSSEIENAAVALKTLDKNQDGKLEGSELRPNFDSFRGAGGTPPGAEDMIARMMAMDADKDGKLSKEEAPERLQSMFARGDKNEDGFLDKEEMMTALRERMGTGRGGFGGGAGFGPGPGFGGGDFVGQMMDRADKDKDGRLTGDEIPPFLRDRLERIDTNKDSALDKAELDEMGKRMAQGRGEGQGRDGEKGRGRRPPAEDDKKE